MLRKVLGKACNFEPQLPKANSRRDFVNRRYKRSVLWPLLSVLSLVYESAPLLSDPEYQLFFSLFFREASKGGRKTGGGEAFKNQSRNT